MLRVRSRIAVRRPRDRSAIFRALYVRTHRDPRDGTRARAEWLLPTSCGTAVRTLPQTFPWTGDARGDPGPAAHSSGHSPTPSLLACNQLVPCHADGRGDREKTRRTLTRIVVRQSADPAPAIVQCEASAATRGRRDPAFSWEPGCQLGGTGAPPSVGRDAPGDRAVSAVQLRPGHFVLREVGRRLQLGTPPAAARGTTSRARASTIARAGRCI